MDETIKNDYIYFSLNHWSTDYYPDTEPFVSWMSDYYETPEEEAASWIREPEILDKYCKENELVMVVCLIDMSINFCVTAKKEWVEKECPKLLTEYTKFIYKNDDTKEQLIDNFGCPFLEWNKENIGVHFYDYGDKCFLE